MEDNFLRGFLVLVLVTLDHALSVPAAAARSHVLQWEVLASRRPTTAEGMPATVLHMFLCCASVPCDAAVRCVFGLLERHVLPAEVKNRADTVARCATLRPR